MQEQMIAFIGDHLSPYLCGYRKGYNAQYALIAMIEKWKKSLDVCGMFAAILMDLSKAFDTINHELLIAKLHAYGFEKSALSIVNDYLSNRWQRVKVNSSFSNWSQLLSGVPQGSVLGPLLFNIYINDLFLELVNTHTCNFADDTTLSVSGQNLEDLIHELEDDCWSAILWYENNFMQLNQSKCHLLASGTHEHLFVRVGEEMIWESRKEKLLGILLDKNLDFEEHLSVVCKKASQKVSALARVARILSFPKRRLIMNTFIESQFSYCPLVWMFCSRDLNRKINYIHERALRLVYDDYTSTFEDLLKKDESLVFHHRNIHQLAIEMYKVKYNLSPIFMQELFTHNPARGKDRFLRPNVKSVTYGDNSLRVFGPIIWNEMLPENLKSCVSLESFKESIKGWIPTNCKCRLCRTYIPRVGYMNVTE